MKIKILISLFVLICMLCFCNSFATIFDDVAGTKYEDAVSKLVGDGIVNGFEDNTYRPKNNVTRAQLTKMLVEMLKLDVTGKEGKNFSDVLESHWAFNYIKRATANSVINGYDDGTFKPDKEVSFVEAAAMMLRRMDLDSELDGLNWPDGYILLALNKGLYTNVEVEGLNFNNSANRGEVAIMLYNFINIMEEKNKIIEQSNNANNEEIIKLDLNKSWNGKYVNIVDGYMELELEQDGNTLNYSFKGYKYGNVRLGKSSAEINGNVATEVRDILNTHLKLTFTRTEEGIRIDTESNVNSYGLLNGLYKIDNGGLNKIEYSNPNRLDANYKLGDSTITLSETSFGKMNFIYKCTNHDRITSIKEMLDYSNNIASVEKPGFFDDDEPTIIKVEIKPDSIIVEASSQEDSINSNYSEINGTYLLDSYNTSVPTIDELKKEFKGYEVGEGVYMGF